MSEIEQLFIVLSGRSANGCYGRMSYKASDPFFVFLFSRIVRNVHHCDVGQNDIRVGFIRVYCYRMDASSHLCGFCSFYFVHPFVYCCEAGLIPQLAHS